MKTMFGKDDEVTTFELYEEFESFKRPPEMSIAEYCNEFDRRLKKLQAKDTQLPEPVLVLRLLKSANLSESEERLVRATIGQHTYVNMTAQLKKVFPTGSRVKEVTGGIDDLVIKDEPLEVNETLYYRGNRYSRDDRRFSNKSGNANYGQETQNTAPKKIRGTNKLDIYGNVTRCNICDSTMHYKKDCPHRSDKEYGINQGECLEESGQVKSADDKSFTYEIVEVEAHHAIAIEPEEYAEVDISKVSGHTMNIAIVDCGAAKNVTGTKWLDSYKESLSDTEKGKIFMHKTNNIFKFGCGSKIPAAFRVTIPALIGDTNVAITTDVVEGDLPLLLSRDCLKQAQSELNFREDTIYILGQKLNLILTDSGHYGLPLGRQLIEDEKRNPAKCVDEFQAKGQFENTPESQLQKDTFETVENKEESEEGTNAVLTCEEELSVIEKSIDEPADTVKTRSRDKLRKNSISSLRRTSRGTIYSSKKVTSASSMKTMVSRKCRIPNAKHKAKYSEAASCHLDEGRKIMTRRKKRVRYKTIQRKGKLEPTRRKKSMKMDIGYNHWRRKRKERSKNEGYDGCKIRKRKKRYKSWRGKRRKKKQCNNLKCCTVY